MFNIKHPNVHKKVLNNSIVFLNYLKEQSSKVVNWENIAKMAESRSMWFSSL